jgi:hypothetical protein
VRNSATLSVLPFLKFVEKTGSRKGNLRLGAPRTPKTERSVHLREESDDHECENANCQTDHADARAGHCRAETRGGKRDAVPVPAKSGNTAAVSTTPDTRTDVQKYLDEIAPANIVGRMVKFSKDGQFVTADDEGPVDEAAEFVALCDEVLIGWIKFHKDGETAPVRVQGLLYDGFKMPPRETLGDMDETQWGDGLGGKPEDPWKHQMCLVLQRIETGELFTFVTTSDTGRRAVGSLLRHFDRMRRAGADDVPVVRLRAGGFNHRDPRVGWVPTPVFAIVGKAPRDSAARPDTSIAADLNDKIPGL